MKHLACITAALLLWGTACSHRNPLYTGDGGSDPDGYAADRGVAFDGVLRDFALTDGAATGCTTNAQCGDGMFCSFATGCGKLGPGTCAVRPRGCPEYYSPVCGCDGVTYGNACDAASAGISVASQGACASPKSCGDLNQDYIAAVQAAKQCSPMSPLLQCQLEVANALQCACPTHVEQGNTMAIATLKQIEQQFDTQGCVHHQCGMPCKVATPGLCAMGPGGVGSCD